ncbi:unnamed protein product [Somion occarium]|uniref:Uncharacterized protein n=1 Tax=Somion occarium TaxID=3059160 RepID=A0ABP1DXC9_9APHY
MAIPAECPNCNQTNSNNQQPSNHRNSSPNLGVITGVLGGLALIAILVFVIVPLVRRRKGRQARKVGDVESSPTSERRPTLFSYISRGPSSLRHHRKTTSGPDQLLPLLPPLSTFTWSDLRSQNTSVDSKASLDDEDGMEKVEIYSFPTDNATTSHQSRSGWAQGGRSVKTGERPARSAWSAHVSASGLPSPQRSPTPPGLPSESSLPADQDKSAQAPSASAKPNTSLVLSPRPLPFVEAFTLTVSGIEPLMEHPVKTNKRSSRPASIQLPSPPASPPVSQSSQPGSFSRSRSVRSQSNATLPQSDVRFNRFRPPLSSNQSAPTSLPFRPPTSSHSSSLPYSPSPVVPATPGQSTTQSPPLTGAFRNDLLRSGSSSSGAGNDSPSRYPAVTPSDSTLPTSISRRRSGSTASERPPPRVPLESRLRPSDMFRRASLSANAPVIPGQRSLTSDASSVMSLPIGGGDGAPEPSASRAYLRMSGSHHTTPQYETTSTSYGGQGGSLPYFDPTTQRDQSYNIQPSSSSHTNYNQTYTSTSGSSNPGIRPLPIPPVIPSSSSSSSSSAHPLPQSILTRDNSQTRKMNSKSAQPNLVKRKDSSALRPLPTSPFLHSPPTSPPLRPVVPSTRSRGGSISSLNVMNPHPYSNRSRAGSVVTLGEPRFESVKEGVEDRLSEEGSSDADSRRSTRAVLPPLKPLPALQFSEFAPGK